MSDSNPLAIRHTNATYQKQFYLNSSPDSERKKLTPVIFPPAILAPEMAVPNLWAPGISWFFLLEIENPHTHKIPHFRGGGYFGVWGGDGSANSIFMGAVFFSD